MPDSLADHGFSLGGEAPAARQDEAVAEMALRLDLATGEQIAAAAEKMTSGERQDLAAVLVSLGALTDGQARTLREIADALGDFSVPPPAEARSLNADDPRTIRMEADPGGATTPVDSAAPGAWGMAAADMPSARYELGREIGRGGLGRVVEALDRVFNRQVALKLLVRDAKKDALSRFRHEAIITSRLDHPHIVAVHDMGELGGTRDAFYAMKRIQGEDLAKIIAKRSWPQRRLIEAFRDVCLAIAYAHSRGVIHRDLKPANIMLGEFGEVFVVDWGLARSNQVRSPEPEAPAGRALDPRLTLAGSIIGTPNYMSPEQALGSTEDIDERSDVYGLGAILYQILCGRPPFDGPDYRLVLDSVVADPPRSPSAFAVVDHQLEAICLKALSKSNAARQAGARALADDIDAWLEGIRDLERRFEIARRHLEDAEKVVERWNKVVEEWREARVEQERSKERLAAQDDQQALRAAWRLEDRLEALARRGLELFHEADVKFGAALSVLPDHQVARRLRASLWWQKFLVAEEEGDGRAMLGARHVLESLDGSWTTQLRGEGTLSVETRAWKCPCLNQGRRVADAEYVVCGRDPWTGDAAAAPSGHPHFMRVHGEACLRAPAPDAEVWFYRYLESDRVLVPMGDGVGGPEAHELSIRRLFGDSAFLPRRPGLFLGRTPLRELRVPMGPGVLLVQAPGREPVLVPLSIGRGERLDCEVSLFSPGEMPPSSCLVTRPPRRSGALRPGPRFAGEALLQGDAFVEKFPVTCGQYAEFLNSLALTSPREALRRVPRASESADTYWQEDSKGRFAVPAGEWREDWPVVGVSWEDAMAYARWKSGKEGRLWCLLPEPLWQRAAQGEDRRPFPWGERRVAEFSHNLESARGRQLPEPVGARPFDESPFGARDMAGNVSQWCLDDAGDAGAGQKIARGGNWSASHLSVDCTTRLAGAFDLVHPTIGFRVCSPATLEGKRAAAAAGGPAGGASA